nr:TlpA family protein disulfide reductase [Treponema sp.]
MKKLFAIVTFIALAAATFAQKAGDKVSFSSKDMAGNAVTSDIFAKNKLTMVNIWGTFCPPCIREMPDLAKLNSANKSNGVEVIGIPIDIVDRKGNVVPYTKADGDAIIKQTGADYTHVVPTKAMMDGFLKNVQVVPATIFVDKNGKIVGQVYLGARSQKDWQKIIDSLLSKQK